MLFRLTCHVHSQSGSKSNQHSVQFSPQGFSVSKTFTLFAFEPIITIMDDVCTMINMGVHINSIALFERDSSSYYFFRVSIEQLML